MLLSGAFFTVHRRLSSSSPNLLGSAILSILLPRLLSTITAAAATAVADAVAHYCHLLRSSPPPSNLELSLSLSLSQSPTKFHPSIITSVLLHFPSPDPASRLSALRFFVWAGLQPTHRHSAASYSGVCTSLQIPLHPNSPLHLLDAYHANNFPVSLKTFTILLNICRSANLPDQALSLLRRIPEFGCRADTPSYNAVIRLLAASGRGTDAANLLDEMFLACLRPDLSTYTSVVKGLCSGNRLDAARVLVSKMPANGCTPNVVVYSALLDGACECGDIDSAVAILEEMEGGDDRCAPNVVSYTCLIKCLCEKGRVMEALGVFVRMGQHGCFPNRVTVATLVKGFCAEGRVTDAFEVVERVVGEGSVSGEEGYSSFVVCLLQVGMVEEAERLTERMLATGVSPDGSACNSLMRKLCLRRRFLDGYHWLRKFDEKGSTCVDFDVYSSVLAGLCEESHLDEAVMLGSDIVERGIQVETACTDSVEMLKMNGLADLASRIMKLIRGT